MRIYWGEVQETDYFHGTRYRTEGKSVWFDNPLMPATMVIHRWTSWRPYQANRRPVTLPLLRKGCQYRLSKHMTVLEGNPLYLKVLFYDRYQDLVSQVFIKDDEGDFVYPEVAYRYEIELVNTACQRFRFDYLTLTEIGNAKEEGLRYPQASGPLTVLFQEALEDDLPEAVLTSLGNVLVISPEEETGDFISSHRLSTVEHEITEKLASFPEGRLVAYGPYGGLAVAYLSFFLPNTTGYHLGINREELTDSPFTFGLYLEDVLPRQHFGRNLITYYREDDNPLALALSGNAARLRQLFHLEAFLLETRTHEEP